MKQFPTGYLLAKTSQKRLKNKTNQKKIIFLTGSSGLPVLVRRWITRANCDKDLLISPAFVGKPQGDFNQPKSKFVWQQRVAKVITRETISEKRWNDMEWLNSKVFGKGFVANGDNPCKLKNQTGPRYNGGIVHNKKTPKSSKEEILSLPFNSRTSRVHQKSQQQKKPFKYDVVHIYMFT